MHLVIITCGSDGPLISETEAAGISCAPGLHGLIRTARIELPKVKFICVDSDALIQRKGKPESELQVATQVLHELKLDDDNTEVAQNQKDQG